MKKIQILTLGIFGYLLNINSQTLNYPNITLISFCPIVENELVEGYGILYMVDKVNEAESNYKLVLLDNNLKETKTINLIKLTSDSKEFTSTKLMGISFNGSAYCVGFNETSYPNKKRGTGPGSHIGGDSNLGVPQTKEEIVIYNMEGMMAGISKREYQGYQGGYFNGNTYYPLVSLPENRGFIAGANNVIDVEGNEKYIISPFGSEEINNSYVRMSKNIITSKSLIFFADSFFNNNMAKMYISFVDINSGTSQRMDEIHVSDKIYTPYTLFNSNSESEFVAAGTYFSTSEFKGGKTNSTNGCYDYSAIEKSYYSKIDKGLFFYVIDTSKKNVVKNITFSWEKDLILPYLKGINFNPEKYFNVETKDIIKAANSYYVLSYVHLKRAKLLSNGGDFLVAITEFDKNLRLVKTTFFDTNSECKTNSNATSKVNLFNNASAFQWQQAFQIEFNFQPRTSFSIDKNSCSRIIETVNENGTLNISLKNGEFYVDKISFHNCFIAKPGYFGVMDYDKKSKNLKLYLEKTAN